METVLSIQNLSKRYGRITAVNDLSLEIPKGSIFGILGPNGSGKTTTLGMVLDVLHPNSGTYSWFGLPPSTAARKRVGAILEGPLFYPYLTATNNLKVVADIKGADYKRIDAVLEQVGLLERKDYPFKTFSLGMKQRLAIAAALLNKPDVLILDEPTNGLDPQGIVEIRQLVRDIAKDGVTILLASHLLDEVEKVCSHVAVLKRGKLLYSGPVGGLISGEGVVVLQASDLEQVRTLLEKYPGVTSISENEGQLLAQFGKTPDPADLNKYMFEQGVTLSHLDLRSSTLEEQFLELTQ
ncbi:MAG TPA: ABC transporter ATP-binding protein [Bacteroidetes bacterium]|nr:ABC transporter ATP-binding protein [Bacteroidota bacterium]